MIILTLLIPLLAQVSSLADQKTPKPIPKLEINGEVYENVTLTAVRDNEISITHDGGVATIPLASLSRQQIEALNTTSTSKTIPPPGQTSTPAASTSGSMQAVPTQQAQPAKEVGKTQKSAPDDVSSLLRQALTAAEAGNRPVMDQLLLQVAKDSPNEPAIAAIRKAGNDLASAQAAINQLNQAAGPTKAEAARLRQNAKNIDHPNPLIPRDTSYMQRADQMRKQADQIESQMKESLLAAEKQFKSAQAELTAINIPEPSSSPAAVAAAQDTSGAAPVTPGGSNVAQDAPVPQNNNLTDDDIFVGLHNPAFSISPRGPKVHGLQLGMSYDDFFKTVQTAYPSKMQIGFYENDDRYFDVGVLVGKPNTRVFPMGFVANEEKFQVGAILYGKGGDKNRLGIASATFIGAGPKKTIIYFSLERPLLQKLFKFGIGSMSYDEFCQKFIDNYDIPKLSGKKVNGMSAMYYVSPDGWKVVFEGADSIGITAVHFIAVPTEKEQGFGQ